MLVFAVMLATAPIATVSYGDHVKQRVDVYAPASPTGRAPVAVFLHGGVWQHGDRTHYRAMGDELARAGFVAFVASYRLAPAHKWPAQLDDARAALALAVREAPRFGGDPARVVVIGHSAGGQLATLLALDEKAGATLHALALFSPVADVELPLDERQRDGGFAQFVAPVFMKAQLDDASPLRALTRGKRKLDVPVLLVTSARDYRAMHAQTTALHKALVASGANAKAELIDLPRVDHFEMVERLDDALRTKLRALVP